MRNRKSFERAIFNSIMKFDDMSGTACGHEEAVREASDYLFNKTLPLIWEAMRTAHEAGKAGISWETWSKAKKNLTVEMLRRDMPVPVRDCDPTPPGLMVCDRPDRHGDGSDAADYEPGPRVRNPDEEESQ